MALFILVILGFGWNSSLAQDEGQKGSKDQKQTRPDLSSLPKPLQLKETIAAWRRHNVVKDCIQLQKFESYKSLPTSRPFDEKSQKEAEFLIKQLGDDDPSKRDDATEKLKKMGPSLLPLAQKHKDSKDPEVKTRIEQIITSLLAEKSERQTAYDQLKNEAEVFPKSFKDLFEAALTAIHNGDKSFSLQSNTILESLDALESQGIIHHGIVAWFWRRLSSFPTEQRKDLPIIYKRLHQHAVMYNALVEASFGVAPYLPRAWMSKAGPRPEDKEAETLAIGKILGALPDAYSKTDAGLWDRESRVRLSVIGEKTCLVIQKQQEKKIGTGDSIDFNRLNLIQTTDKVSLKHEWIGTIELPANSIITTWELPGLLNDEAKKAIHSVMEDALAGDAKAAAKIERSLPLVHEILRLELQKNPKSSGAPRLRLILQLFE